VIIGDVLPSLLLERGALDEPVEAISDVSNFNGLCHALILEVFGDVTFEPVVIECVLAVVVAVVIEVVVVVVVVVAEVAEVAEVEVVDEVVLIDGGWGVSVVKLVLEE
jgi:hypothetical protein